MKALHPPPQRWKRALPPALLSLLCFYFLYSMNSGITITNDGSHFALFDSLVSNGSPELLQVRQFAYGDSAKYQDRYYSDRNPGLALFTSLVYQPTRVLEPHLQALFLDPKFAPAYTAQQRLKIPLVMLVPAMAGALAFLFGFLLARQLGVAYWPALLSSLAIIAGTILLRYGTVFYSHSLAAALLSGGLLLVFSARRQRRGNRLAAGIFLLSCAVLVEHLLVLVFFAVLPYLLTASPELRRRGNVLKAICAGLLPMSVLMSYNTICFDSPFSIAHFHHASDPQNHQLNSLLRVEQSWNAALNLLFGAPRSEVGRQDLVGLFSSSPFLWITLLFPWAIATGEHGRRSEYLVLAACISLLVIGASSVFAPYGGWDRDYRYFAAMLPLLAPFLGCVLQALLRPSTSVPWNAVRIALLAGCAGLLILSIGNQLQHLRHPAQVQYPALLVNLEPALVNVSLFLALCLAVAAAAWPLLKGLALLRSRKPADNIEKGA